MNSKRVAFCLVLVLHSAVAVIPSGPISAGEKSDRVSAIQNMLMGLTYPISATGAFGKHTAGFVSQFQADEGLNPTSSSLEFTIIRDRKAPIKVCMESSTSYAVNFLLPAETSDKFMRESYLTTRGEIVVKALQQSAGIEATGEIDAATLLSMFKIDGRSTAKKQNVNDLESRESGYDGIVSCSKDPKVSVYDGPDEGEEDPECRGGGRRKPGAEENEEDGSVSTAGGHEEAGQRDKLAKRKGKTSVKKAKPGNRKQITGKKAKTTKKGRKVRG